MLKELELCQETEYLPDNVDEHPDNEIADSTGLWAALGFVLLMPGMIAG
jgi:hypothetical protein